jgi:hypothetical protein
MSRFDRRERLAADRPAELTGMAFAGHAAFAEWRFLSTAAHTGSPASW